MDDELLALVLQKIVFSTLIQSLIDFSWVGNIDWVESDLGEARNQDSYGWSGRS